MVTDLWDQGVHAALCCLHHHYSTRPCHGNIVCESVRGVHGDRSVNVVSHGQCH